MTGGQASISEVTGRIAQLQARLGIGRGPGGSAGTSSSGFSSALTDALTGALTGAEATAADGGAAGVEAGRRAVALARGLTGVPYVWGGNDPKTGLDCSGLTKLVYGKLGVTLPRVASDQARTGTAVASLADAQPGDLVFFGSPAHHVGIFVGDGKMIDAPHRGATVGVHEISGYGAVSAIRRMAPATAGAQVPASSAGTLALARAELLSAAGLSSLSALAPASTGAVTRATAGSGGALSGPYAALFLAAGARHRVDPALLSAVAKVESGYDASAVSPAGARGLMQLMPGTARSLGVDAGDPAQAVDGAARLLRDLFDRYDGRVDLALAGYNAGPGAVARYGGVPPYRETRNYVERVTSAWEALR